MIETQPTQYFSPQPKLSELDLELLGFTAYAAARWRVIAMASVVAVTAVLLVSLVLPKKYTASASILIEPPAGNDPRGSTAVSPVYLESLKTYEHFALSDSLFKEAIDSLQVRAQFAGLAMETVKRKILQVTKPRDTKILEVRVTLNNPEKARDLAWFIAQRTVK